jgi:hypothetical protein
LVQHVVESRENRAYVWVILLMHLLEPDVMRHGMLLYIGLFRVGMFMATVRSRLGRRRCRRMVVVLNNLRGLTCATRTDQAVLVARPLMATGVAIYILTCSGIGLALPSSRGIHLRAGLLVCSKRTDSKADCEAGESESAESHSEEERGGLCVGRTSEQRGLRAR